MRTPSLTENTRHWLVEHASALVLTAAASVIIIVLTVFALPFGRRQTFDGIVQQFGFVETETGSYPLAIVKLPKRVIQVQLPLQHACRIGSPITIVKRNHLLGQSYSAAYAPC